MKARLAGALLCLLALAAGCGVNQLVGLDSVDAGPVRDGGDDDDDGGDDGDVRAVWGTAPDAGWAGAESPR